MLKCPMLEAKTIAIEVSLYNPHPCKGRLVFYGPFVQFCILVCL